MPSYQLNIDFDPSDLATIYKANERVVITKQVSPNSTPVAWIAFDPFINNTIQWEDNYALYASTSSVQNGTTITKLSEVAAAPQVNYDFCNGAFNYPINMPSLPMNTYSLKNLYPSDKLKGITFGLTQDITLNGEAMVNNPINAQYVPSHHSAQFTPYEIINVYLDYATNSGMVVTNVFSSTRQLKFGGNSVNQTIVYNSATGDFSLK